VKRASLNKFDANIVRITAMLQTNSDTIRLDFAKALAREVGILAREMQKNLGRVEQKGHQDYVSEVDRNIEAMIRDKVIEAFPGDVMLGEELGGQIGDSLWVVDPIDGTSNFVRGQSFWCVSISYLRDGKPVVGVIYAPATDELFYARAGQGAFCNGAPMRVKKVNNESEAVIEMDWSPSESPEELISMLAKFLKAGFEFHRSGSCACVWLMSPMARWMPTGRYLRSHGMLWLDTCLSKRLVDKRMTSKVICLKTRGISLLRRHQSFLERS